MRTKFINQKKFWTLLLLPLFFLSFKAALFFMPGLDSIEAIGPFVNGNLPSEAGSTAIELQEIHTNIEWESPQVAIPFPNSNDLLVVEMDGRFFTIPDNDNASLADRNLVMDIQDRCWYYGWAGTVTNKHGGFQNAVFHPEFGQGTGNDYIYVYYLYHPAGNDNITGGGQRYYNRLSRFTWIGSSFNPNSELIMIQQYDTAAGHDGGGLVFDNDGFLYVSVGDEGTQNAAATDHTQKLDDRFRSGVWRIDVDMQGGNISHPIDRQINNSNVPQGAEPSFNQGYYIPNNNPWATGTGEFLEEFYAIGLRQPFRMSYDKLTENIWIGDVGGGQVEEIDILDEPGLNFQWNYKEGLENGFRAKPVPFYGEEREPALDYGRGEGRAIIGGFIYRGSAIPSLFGKYVFGDNGNGNVFSLTHNGGNSVSDLTILGNVGGSVFNGISSLGYTHDNELMILKLSAAGTNGQGKIFKIVQVNENDVSEQLPALLSETGVFSNLQNLTPAAGVIPYDVVNPLWSSGTDKSRWVAIPQDGNVNSVAEQIGYSENGPWSFPVGTTFIKQFNNPNGTKLETRLWIHGEGGEWYGSTYKWRANGLEADLLLAGDVDTITIDGETFDYEFPASNTCVQCHNSAAGNVLGFSTRQLNRDIVYPSTGRTANQLETLAGLGFIPQVNTNTVATLVAIDDNNESVETRVRSYFDSNCAYCHLPGNTRASFDMRFSTPFAQQGLINGAIIENLGIQNGVAIAPGDIDRSLIHHRANSVDIATMMPPLAKGRIDTEAVQLMEAWINSLNGNCAPENATVIGNTGLTDGNFIDGHSPHINVNATDIFTNNTTEAVSVCLEEFTFYARRVGNPVTPFVTRVDGQNEFTVIAIGQTRVASQYNTGVNTFNFSDHTNDAVVLQPGESIAPGYMDAFPDGSGSVAGSSLIPAITSGTPDRIWQSFQQNANSNPHLVMGSIPQGNSIAPNLSRSYQFNIGINVTNVDVFVPTEGNLALNKPTTQSSTDFDGVASRAVDGNTNGVYFGGNSVTHTNGAGSTNPWWRVDLGATYDVSTINIFNRIDSNCDNGQACGLRLSEGVVYVGNTPSNNPNDYTAVATLNSNIEQQFNNVSATGRYVMVYLPGNNRILSLAEVQVFGEEEEEPVVDNLALNQPAVQSSTGFGGVASRAVDGNTNGDYVGNSVTHTAPNNATAWWRVDLGAVYDLTEVRIFNRTNCCAERLSGVMVYAGTQESTDPADYTQIGGALTAQSEQIRTNVEVQGRYVFVYSATGEVISLAEVQVFGEAAAVVPPPVDNLALNQPAVQSSTDFDGVASRAVDGNTNGVYFGGNSVTHTNGAGSTNPWWRVDLGATYDVSTINIFNRIDSNCDNGQACGLRLSEGVVYVGNTPSNNPNDYTAVATLNSNIEQSLSNVSATGRYVMVYLPGNNKILSLAEVEVFGNLVTDTDTVAVTGVSISSTTVQLDEGANTTLVATVSPSNANNQAVSWTSNNTAVATVNNNGLVTAVAEGQAIITVTTNDGSFTATSNITVNGTGSGSGTDNLALNQPSVQSSTDFDGVASRAVDGNTNGVYFGGNSVTHTNGAGSTNPWWRVDLGATYDVSTINIFNRIDSNCDNGQACGLRLSEGVVYVGNTPSNNPNDYTAVATLNSNIEQQFNNVSATGRYVMVYLPGNNRILSLAEVQVFGEEEEEPVVDNLALNQPTTQSSTDHGGASSRAVDGNTSGIWLEGSITHTVGTPGSTNPWWRVDLGGTYAIDQINVFNRTDCCSGRLEGAVVYIGSLESTNPLDYTQVGTLTSNATHTINGQEIVGRYVMIQIPGNNKILSLAEVEVFGEGSDDTTPNDDTVGPLMSVIPNPVNEMLHINSDTPMQQSALIQIYSSVGGLVMEDEIIFDDGIQASTYVGGLNTGVYTVVILNPATGQSSTVQMIKN